MARLPYSLLLACLLVLLASPNPTSALSHAVGNPNANGVRHLQHAQLADSKKRMVKVRQLLREGAKGAGIADGGNDAGLSTTATSAAATTTTTQAAVTTTPAAKPTTTTTPAASQSVATTTTDAAQSASSSSDVSSSAASSTTISTTTTPPAVSTTQNLVTQSSLPVASISSGSQSLSVATAQVTVDLPTQSADADASNTSANTFGRNTIIAIVVIASCVGGAAAIWTLIRKWKLGPSAKFEERMAPIEWSPDMGSTAGAGIPGAEREKTYGATEKHSRSGSHGSFHSSDAEHNNLGRNVTGNGNMFADQHPTSYAPDAHDFTAGPAHYGNTGYDAYGNPAANYVDLQRTNSNGSNHSDRGGLQRGPSDAHGAPAAAAAPYAFDNNAYNGAAYGHDAYGHDAYGGHDAYAGYDAYGQHYPAQQGQYGAQQGQYGARY